MNDQKKWRQVHQATRQRFAEYFFEFARTRQQAFDQLERDWWNPFLAIGYFERAKNWARVIELVFALNDFLDHRGYWQELIAALDLAIDSADRTYFKSKPEQEAEALLWRVKMRALLMLIYFRQGEYAESERLGKEALRFARELNHKQLQAMMLGHLGTVAQAQGRRGEAERLLQESHRLLIEIDDGHGITLSLHRLAILAQARGHLKQAEGYEAERLERSRAANDEREIGNALSELGSLAVEEAEYEQARAYYEESRALRERLSDQAGLAEILNRLSELELKQGAKENALVLAQERLAFERQRGDRAAVLDALQDVARLLLEREETEAAYAHYQEALQLATELEHTVSKAFILQALGGMEESRGNEPLVLNNQDIVQ